MSWTLVDSAVYDPGIACGACAFPSPNPEAPFFQTPVMCSTFSDVTQTAEYKTKQKFGNKLVPMPAWAVAVVFTICIFVLGLSIM